MNPPTILATHFPFWNKSWLMPLQAMVCYPLEHQFFTSLCRDRGKRDLGEFLASLGMISCPTFPLSISTSTVFRTNNLNEKSLGLWGSFLYGPILCWVRAAPRQASRVKGKAILTVLQPYHPTRHLHFQTFLKHNFCLPYHAERGLNLFNTCLRYLSKLIHHSCKTSDRRWRFSSVYQASRLIQPLIISTSK